MRTHFDLRARFDELRRVDGSRAPGFGELVRSPGALPTTGSSRSRATWMALAATGVAAVVIVATLRLGAFDHRTAEPISAWRSPTSGLVPTTGQAVLAPPPLLSSVLDGATSSALWRKGD